MMKRAQENKIVDLHIHNLRDWTTDKHHIMDDAPFTALGLIATRDKASPGPVCSRLRKD
jgi:tRNA (guanine37-N1)-methyltransferase